MGYAKGRATKHDIVEKATELFGEGGYRGTSLREIAARCGLSHPGLLHHFPTKQSLLLAVLERRDDLDASWISAAAAPADAADPADAVGPANGLVAAQLRGVAVLRRLVDLAAHNASRRGLVELFTVLSAEATAPDHPAHDFFVTRYRRIVGEVQIAYADARTDGDLRPEVHPPAAARELVALMDGLQIHWLLTDSTIDMAAVLDGHLSTQLQQ